jgi:hypothetical protein
MQEDLIIDARFMRGWMEMQIMKSGALSVLPWHSIGFAAVQPSIVGSKRLIERSGSPTWRILRVVECLYGGVSEAAVASASSLARGTAPWGRTGHAPNAKTRRLMNGLLFLLGEEKLFESTDHHGSGARQLRSAQRRGDTRLRRVAGKTMPRPKNPMHRGLARDQTRGLFQARIG